VSGCLLAHVNAFGMSVRLSVRGETNLPDVPQALPLAPAVPVGQKYQESNTVIESFKKCLLPTSGPARNCGWRTEHVGVCTPGETVEVAAGTRAFPSCTGAALGGGAGDPMLRVCKGILGCNYGSATFITHSDDACATQNPSVSFVCPAQGYYSVMSAPYYSSYSYKATPAARRRGSCTHSVALTGTKLTASCTSCATRVCASDSYCCNNYWDDICVNEAASWCDHEYPGTEAEVFQWREGAFYGNVFKGLNPYVKITVDKSSGLVRGRVIDSKGLLHFVNPDTGALFDLHIKEHGPIYTNMYACWSSNWSSPEAYELERICAGVSSVNCSAEPIGACTISPTGAVPAHLCKDNDGPVKKGDMDYQDCKGTVGFWEEPVTTVLNQPCDMVRGGGDVPGTSPTAPEGVCATVKGTPLWE
jgi:hypothetical protein